MQNARYCSVNDLGIFYYYFKNRYLLFGSSIAVLQRRGQYCTLQLLFILRSAIFVYLVCVLLSKDPCFQNFWRYIANAVLENTPAQLFM